MSQSFVAKSESDSLQYLILFVCLENYYLGNCNCNLIPQNLHSK